MKTFRSSLWISLSATAYFLITPPVAKADQPATPTLISVSPASGAQGASVPVTLTGANFDATALVMVDQWQIRLSNVSVISSTQITATLYITALDALEAAHVTVITMGGTSNAVLFTVTYPPPTLQSVVTGGRPDRGSVGNMLILCGQYLTDSATLTFQ
jgi:hypothetical protein